MAIRPIDLQTNMSQVTEVGKDAQARTEAVVQQQHGLERESGEKARLVNARLDETKKGESAVIRDQQKKEEKRREHATGSRDEEGKKKARRAKGRDDRMGNIIDVMK
jgi:hypothetical protein